LTDPKHFSNLQARAALLGVILLAVGNDAEHWTYIATLGPVTLDIPTLEGVERWLDGLSAMVEAKDAA
jgi:hypothetical protein